MKCPSLTWLKRKAEIMQTYYWHYLQKFAIAHDYGLTLLKIPPYYIYTQHEVPFINVIEAKKKKVEWPNWERQMSVQMSRTVEVVKGNQTHFTLRGRLSVWQAGFRSIIPVLS